MRSHFRLLANRLHPFHDLIIELVVLPHGVVDAVSALDQTRQNVINIRNRIGIINRKILNGCIRTHQDARPQFLFLIFFLAEQNHFSLLAAGDQRQQSVLFSKAGQVIKITVLAV